MMPRTPLVVSVFATAVLLTAGCRAPSAHHPAPPVSSTASNAEAEDGHWDAHTHLSMYGADALDSLAAHGVVAVRDLGGDLELSLRWRAEYSAGRRRGPRLFTAGAILDGPKPPGATPRWTIRTPDEAERAVDSLAVRRVDFIKTHNGLSPENYFAVLRRARLRGLRVASHLPRGVPAWTAADSGAGSLEHAAESMLASPLYAGYATTIDEAMRWWRSPAGDSMLAHLAAAHPDVAITPTLALYAANVDRPAAEAERAGRRAVLTFLVELTGRIHRAGIPVLAGSDVSTRGPDAVLPGPSLATEIQWLERAGLSRAEARAAAGRNIARWLQSGAERTGSR